MYKLTDNDKQKISDLFSQKDYQAILKLIEPHLTNATSHKLDTESRQYIQPYLFAIAIKPEFYNLATLILEKIYITDSNKPIPMEFANLFSTNLVAGKRFLQQFLFSKNPYAPKLALDIFDLIFPELKPSYKDEIMDLINQKTVEQTRKPLVIVQENSDTSVQSSRLCSSWKTSPKEESNTSINSEFTPTKTFK